MLVRKSIISVLMAACIAASATAAGMPLNLTGTSTMSLGGVLVDDQYEDQTLIDGVKVPLRLVLMGRQDALDLSLVTNLYYNEWSEFQTDLFTLNVKHRDFGVVLGDSYVRMRKLTIMNRKVRGVTGHYDLLKVNTTPMLRLQVVGGISEKALEKDERLAHQVYQRVASSDTYRQLLGAFALQMKPMAGMDADVTVLYAYDDDNSVTLFPGETIDAVSNLLLSGSIGQTFWQEKMFWTGEYAHSVTDENTADDAGSVEDDAVKMALDGRVGDVKFRTKFDYVGGNFSTKGNPYLDTDRLGGYGQVGYVSKGLFSADASYESYIQNLDQDTSDFDTKVDEVIGRLGTAWKWNPNLNLTYRFKDELSSVKDDGTIIDRTSHTMGGGIDFSFKKLRASVGVSQKTILDDSHMYIQKPDPADTTITESDLVDSTVNDVTGQLSISTSLRWRPNRTWNVIGGVNNIIGTTEGRDGSTGSTSINYVYMSLITSFAGGKYRPTLDVIFNNYIDDNAAENNYALYKAKLSLDYRVTRTQSAKVFYEFEMNTVQEAGDLDYMANGFGLEYTVLF